MMINMKTKPRGIHANFETECWKCTDTITVSNGRVDYHQCEPDQPRTPADIKF